MSEPLDRAGPGRFFGSSLPSCMRPLALGDFAAFRPLRYGRAYYAARGEHGVFRWSSRLGRHGEEMNALELLAIARRDLALAEAGARWIREVPPIDGRSFARMLGAAPPEIRRGLQPAKFVRGEPEDG